MLTKKVSALLIYRVLTPIMLSGTKLTVIISFSVVTFHYTILFYKVLSKVSTFKSMIYLKRSKTSDSLDPFSRNEGQCVKLIVSNRSVVDLLKQNINWLILNLYYNSRPSLIVHSDNLLLFSWTRLHLRMTS